MLKKSTTSLNNFKKLARSKWLLPSIILLSVILLVISLYFTYRIRPFNSDDVGWQTALLSWHPFGKQVFFLTPDTWIIKAPFFYLMGLIISPGRHLLGVESAILSVINLLLFFWAGIYFIRKAGAKISLLALIPFVWLSSLGFNSAQLLLNTNLRNVEIGLSFVLLMFVAKIYYGEFDLFKSKWTVLGGLIVSVLSGLMIYNDPFFLYFTLVPVAALLCFLYAKRSIENKTLISLVSGLAIAVISWKVFVHIGLAAKIYIANQPAQFVSYQNFYSNLGTAIHALLMVFSADFTGLFVLKVATVTALLNLLLLIFAIYLLVKNLKKLIKIRVADKKIDPATLIPGFLAFCMLAIFFIYSFSNLITNLGTYRYLILLPFFAVLILALWFGTLSKRGQIFVGVITVLAICLNLYGSYNTYKTNPVAIPNRANYLNYQLINALEKHDLRIGFGQYWDSNINTYLSDSKVRILPIVCNGNQTVQFNWIVNEGLYSSSYSGKTYIVTDNQASEPSLCSTSSMQSQFGKPESSFEVGSAYTILIYNYNISSRIPLSNVFQYEE